ncbi:MAG: phosphoenolpyruvate--protein phosphotransferase, partial [Chthoniobacteraceae bacterium]
MKTERRFQGVGVSPGIAHGIAFVHRPDDDPPARKITAGESEREVARLREALCNTRKQIVELQERVERSLGAKDAAIFEAHVMVVEDGVMIDEVEKLIRRESCNAEHAFHTVVHRYIRTLGEMEDPYLRERAVDIHDVGRRVIHNLLGREPAALGGLDAPRIVIAHNLTPSDTVQANREFLLGFATEVGGKTSHTAIMARSLNIPAVVGIHGKLVGIEAGSDVLLDGYGGLLIVDPSEQTLFEYGSLRTRRRQIEEELTGLRDTAAAMRDGKHMLVTANIEQSGDIAQALASGAGGVGLFRTEYLYFNRDDLPGEEEQFAAYRRVAEAARPRPVIIRTLDLGGDKLHGQLHAEREDNPFLGWRAIRVCLERRDIFRTQLRAILRASAFGSVKIMFPMISGLPELRDAKAALEECRAELRAEGAAFDDKLEVGMMIEVPSAAMIADLLAKEVAFFSLGTNDLVQYTTAVDRTNERIAHLYMPTHPAVLRLIKMTVDAAHAAGIHVGVCGEMGGDISVTPLLVGLGVDELSFGAAVIPRVKRAIRS